MSSATDIQARALKLSQRSRLKLAGELLRSIPAAATPEQALAEALRREAELDSGTVQPLSEAAFWRGTGRSRKPA